MNKKKNKYDIFISYGYQSEKFAQIIQQALERRYKVFLDLDKPKEYGVLDERAKAAIEEAPVFLLVLSERALDYCVNTGERVRMEILHAAKYHSHIVPCIINNTFKKWPRELPQEIWTILEPLQFTKLLLSDKFFQESIDKLINYRIDPYIEHEDLYTGKKILMETDADCNLYRTGQRSIQTFVKKLKAGEVNVVYLKAGKYRLVFVSVEFPEVNESQFFSIGQNEESAFLKVTLKDRIKEARDRAEDEERRKQKELEERKLYRICRNGNYGFADKTGKIVIHCRWPWAGDFVEGMAQVGKYDRDLYYDFWSYGFIDKTGILIIPCQWEWVSDFVDGLARVQRYKDGNYGFIDKSGKEVTPCKWESAEDFSYGLALVKEAKGNWGFIDKTGGVVIPCQWKRAWKFSEDLAAVEDANNNWGFIDKTGEVVIPCQWKGASKFSEGQAAVMDSNDKWGYINKTGEVVIPCQWKRAWEFSEGQAAVMDSNDKWGYIDKTGKVVIPCQWESWPFFSHGSAIVKHCCEIDKTGKIISRTYDGKINIGNEINIEDDELVRAIREWVGRADSKAKRFNVFLKETGASKLGFIKYLNSTLGVSLKKAKDIADAVPTVMAENLTEEEAGYMKLIVEEAGGSAEIINNDTVSNK